MSTATSPCLADARAHGAARAFHRDLTAERRVSRVQERGDTARAVAALLDFGAVGVEYPVEDARSIVARGFEHQGLIEADAGVPIRERAQGPRIDGAAGKSGRRVEYKKIVAEALHLRELDAHGGSIAEAPFGRELALRGKCGQKGLRIAPASLSLGENNDGGKICATSWY